LEHETNSATTPDNQGFDLAVVLNILWRRRLIVAGLPLLGLLVGVAYGIFGTKRWEAVATVRPGITAFDPSGGPVRQWQLKDITRWYDQMLYRKEMVKRLGLPAAARPVIRTEFIAQGLTNLAGGDVITLWTTGTSPELAQAFIDTSLVLFNEYAESDTVSSQLKLTRDGLRLQMGELQNQLAAVDRKEAGLGLRLKAARAESLMVAEQTRELAVDLELLERKRAFCLERVSGLQSEAIRLGEDLDRLDGALGQASGSALGDLSQARTQLQRSLARNHALTDSLGYEADVAALARTRLMHAQAAKVAAELREVERKIGELVLSRDLDLPTERRDLGFQIGARRGKLALLAPVQRVGGTLVSDDPVRPRGTRATAILVFLGILGGLVLAFVWDYVSGHRREIFRS